MKKTAQSQEHLRKIFYFALQILQTKAFLSLQELKIYWKEITGSSSGFNSSHMIKYLHQLLPVEKWKSSNQKGVYLFHKGVELQKKIIELNQQNSFNKDKMDFLMMFLSSQARIVSQFILLSHIGASQAQMAYNWNVPQIISKMNSLFQQFGVDLSSYFENKHTLIPDSQWKQIQKLGTTVYTRLPSKRKGGKKPWEILHPQAVAIISDHIQRIDTHIPPNLETLTHYASGITLSQLSQILQEEKAHNSIEFAPKITSLWRAFQGRRQRGNIPIRLLTTLKCQTKSHAHRSLLLKLHQLERDIMFFDSQQPDYSPKGQIIAIDDLAMIELDNLIFNQKQWSLKKRLAPSTDYEKGNRIIFSSHLFLTPHTKNNLLRRKKLLPPLPRFDTDILPVWYRSHTEKLKENGSMFIDITDRSGFLCAVLKPYSKTVNSSGEKKHTHFSKPSSGAQHAFDLYQLLKSPPTSLRNLVFNSAETCLPYLVLTRDNGEDQNLQRIENVLPYWQMMLALDLDALKIASYSPGNSKDHPVEQGNRSLKRTLKGRIISSGDGTQQAFQSSMNSVKNFFRGVYPCW